ncbi:MAG: DUF3302 domain-containing protein [Verrucomicrobiota bacterium]
MESLLGFKISGWDYATFVVLFLLVFSVLFSLLWLAGLPGRIAIARKHPDAEAVSMMGYAGFLAAVPWIQAFIWAFKPTNIVDIRRLPREEAKGIEEEIARLSGKPAPADAVKSPAPDAAPPGKDEKKQG